MHSNKKVHGKTFVVFGGDLDLINEIERMLLFAGCNVHAYSDSFKALSAMEAVRPDIIIFEASENDLPAPEVLAKLASDTKTKDIPLVIIAADEEIETLRLLYTQTQPEFLPKSKFDVMQIILRIETLLEGTPIVKEPLFDFTESDKNVIKTEGQHTLRVLVFEDDSLLRNLLSLRLSKSEIQYDFCHSGLDAIAKVLEYKPTVILLDLMLPGKNGLEILSELRSMPEIADTPVIIFSNKDDDGERSKASALGVTNFLVKATTDLSTLINLIIEKGKTS